jgi:hypothetical protein
VAAGEARWRGVVDKPTGINLVAVLIDTLPGGVNTRREFSIPMVIDPLNGAATYDARLRGIDLTNLTHIEMQARDAITSEVMASYEHDISAFRE